MRRPTYANVAASLALVLSLTGTAVAAARIGSAEIRDNAVASRDIKNGDVRAIDLRDGSVTAAKLANGAVGADKLARGAVGASAVRDGSLTGAKIADGSIGRADLAPDAAPVQTIPFAQSHVAETANPPILPFGPLRLAFLCERLDPNRVLATASWETTVEGGTYVRTSTPSTLRVIQDFTTVSVDTVAAVGHYVSTYVVGGTHVRAEYALFDETGSSCRIEGVATLWTAS